ncbi:MAG: hypothetical protein WC761_00190 [Candidatus Paceibacterota bacterium]|jgi:hypothetical protein
MKPEIDRATEAYCFSQGLLITAPRLAIGKLYKFKPDAKTIHGTEITFFSVARGNDFNTLVEGWQLLTAVKFPRISCKRDTLFLVVDEAKYTDEFLIKNGRLHKKGYTYLYVCMTVSGTTENCGMVIISDFSDLERA